ncbi:hypothetical protein [Adhaeribacter pallidiroseus]|uniref:Lipoprotein n=1 Tax=Adhaeribacter pallidiroseus TaxID=2072847 RepID=A0A369QDT9_9BACT|nr:hypothetical protein [Adhaeribacter pallidiroseus]RDC63071.1 hypothetical protein AHMF7616_01671 [Adhaeribacter pallidiroseus]
MNRWLLICGLLFLVGSCTEDVPIEPEALGLKYYPLKTGEYWIYKVTQTRYQNQFAEQATDSVSYYVREQIDTVFRDLAGEDTYKFTRSRRNTPADAWSQDSVFVVNKSASDVRLTQNNRRVVSFIFPVLEGKKWNAHIFNSQSSLTNPAEETFYFFANTRQPTVVNGINYANTVKVVQLANDNAIEKQDGHEVYGYGVGRIYKQKLAFQYCSDPDRQNGCEIGSKFIITGIKQIERLEEHGFSQ